MVRALAPAEVHVVVTVRDYVRQFPAVWQEWLKMPGEESLDDFMELAFDRQVKGAWSWRSQDAPAILARWQKVVPRDRIQVVTVPPPGAPRPLLWQRWCRAVGLDDTGFDHDVSFPNESLGGPQAAVMLDLKPYLTGDLTSGPVRHRWVRKYFAHEVLVPQDGPKFGPRPDHAARLARLSAKAATQLRRRGYAVDRRPRRPRSGGGRPGAAEPRRRHRRGEAAGRAACHRHPDPRRARADPAGAGDPGAEARAGPRPPRRTTLPEGGTLAGPPSRTTDEDPVTHTPRSVDDRRLLLPGSIDTATTYDVVINDVHVWSLLPSRDARNGRAGLVAPWPPALRKHLVGQADVLLRDHVSGEVLMEAHHVFGGEHDRVVSVTDSSGHGLVLDKWGRLTRPLSAEGSEVVDELVLAAARLLSDLQEKAGVAAFVSYGTLLGAVRDGALIGHDNDLDVSYVSREPTRSTSSARASGSSERCSTRAGRSAAVPGPG